MRGAGVVISALGLVGCASWQAGRGHDQVEGWVQQRTGVSTGWKNGTPEDSHVARRVDALLAEGLTLPGAVEVALVNNPGLQETYEGLGVAQADLVQAGLLSNPKLSAGVGLPLLGGSLQELAFGLVHNFLDLFVLPLRRKLAAEQFAVDVARVAHEALSVSAEVSQAFVGVQAATQKVELQRLLSDAARAQAELAARQREAGNITALDLANQQAADASARVELLREETELLAQRERLNRLLGLFGPQTAWHLKAELTEVPQTEVALDALETRAIRQRLDVRAARGAVALFTSASSLARGSAATGIFELGIDGHRDPDGPVVMGPHLSIELPVFDQRQATLAKLDAQQRQADRHLRKLAIDARSEVREAYARLHAARQEAHYFTQQLLPMRAKVVAQAQLQYNAMQLGLPQLLEARSAQNRSYREYLDAVARYWSSRAELQRAVGGPLEHPLNEVEGAP